MLESNQSKKLDDLLVLRDFGMQIKQGELVCIIGDVGSGKSSMLSAIIGDLLHLDRKFYENHMSEGLDNRLSEAVTFHAQQNIPM